MRRRTAWLSAIVVLVLVGGLVYAAFLVGREPRQAPTPPPTITETTEPEPTAPSPTTTETTTETETETTTEPPAPPPPSVAFRWSHAGALVWHETSLDPTALGRTLRASGFGWIAVRLHDGLSEDPLEDDWVYRFRVASGLPVGGWGVLRTDPEREAELADRLLAHHGLDFYIADAEAEYEFSGPTGADAGRSGRSARFVDAFRARRPTFPAGLSSYCRASMHDLDWSAWRSAGFVYLPQAYVNDFGDDVAPAACAAAARGLFEASDVHPTIGVYDGQRGTIGVGRYARLLAAAGTVGFSVYLAETGMTEADWSTLGTAIRERGIAEPAS
jgi:hypothetical protein